MGIVMVGVITLLFRDLGAWPCNICYEQVKPTDDRGDAMRRPLLLFCCLASGISAQEIFVDGSFHGTSTGRSTAPWPSIQDAFDAQHGNARSGDTITVRPGIYAVTQLWIKIPHITLQRDRNSQGRVILDGGVSPTLLKNRDAQGRQLTINNGTRFDHILGIELTADDVTIDGLEIRNGFCGIFTKADHSRIINCHVHHISQNGIKSFGSHTEISGCFVHDVVLYNLDGQCLAKVFNPQGWPEVNTRKPVLDQGGKKIYDQNGKLVEMDWGQGISISGEYPQDPNVNKSLIAHDGKIFGNVLWNAWSEGYGTYFSKGTLFSENTAFNVWKFGYYLQNADDVQMYGNLSFYSQDGMDEFATKVCYSINNERPWDYFAAGKPSGQPTFPLPDNSNIVFTGNFSFGARILESMWGYPINAQGGTLTISGNLLALPGSDHPCMELGENVRGTVRIRDNVLVKKAGNPQVESEFIRHTSRSGDKPPAIWDISGNTLAVGSSSWSAIQAATNQIASLAQEISLQSCRDAATDGTASLGLLVKDLHRQMTVLKSKLRAVPSGNTPPRIVATSGHPSVITLP